MDKKIKKNLQELNILYVEDEEGVRVPFSMMLKRFVKNLYVAENGEEGLEFFKKYPIDIIISDIKMPKMNGLEMAEKIREISHEIPIIFTTAFGDTAYLKEALEIGVDGYIIKPVNRNKLFNKLNIIAENILNKREIEGYTKLIQTIFNNQITDIVINPRDYGFKLYDKSEIVGADAQENAKITKDILSGALSGAKLDIVLLNAGFALFADGIVNNPKDGIELARDVINSGKAKEKLEQIIHFSSKFDK